VVWAGVRLSDLFAECGPEPAARFAWSHGADHGVFNGVACEAYVKDLPLDLVGADVLVACEMNGAPLPPEHGYPARLVVPGYYGTNSVKWLSRITLAERRATGPFTTRWYNDAVRDAHGEPTGETTPVWSIAPHSLIVSPSPEHTLAVGTPTEIWGWAWADGGASRVEVSVDGGATWQAAALEARTERAWQRFTCPWRPERAGRPELCSRAKAANGLSQPAAGARNAIHRVPVEVVSQRPER
jgi:DMSO/TMAO reductase YedYZ molybdopterin-dependent catalytic subunit